MKIEIDYWNKADKILLKIIEMEILKIRALSFQKDHESISFVADHIHNIPAIIDSHDSVLLQSYLSIDVPSYKSHKGSDNSLDDYWKQLIRILQVIQSE